MVHTITAPNIKVWTKWYPKQFLKCPFSPKLNHEFSIWKPTWYTDRRTDPVLWELPNIHQNFTTSNWIREETQALATSACPLLLPCAPNSSNWITHSNTPTVLHYKSFPATLESLFELVTHSHVQYSYLNRYIDPAPAAHNQSHLHQQIQQIHTHHWSQIHCWYISTSVPSCLTHSGLLLVGWNLGGPQGAPAPQLCCHHNWTWPI
jgi:hypothetical protein